MQVIKLAATPTVTVASNGARLPLVPAVRLAPAPDYAPLAPMNAQAPVRFSAAVMVTRIAAIMIATVAGSGPRFIRAHPARLVRVPEYVRPLAPPTTTSNAITVTSTGTIPAARGKISMTFALQVKPVRTAPVQRNRSVPTAVLRPEPPGAAATATRFAITTIPILVWSGLRYILAPAVKPVRPEFAFQPVLMIARLWV